MRTQSIKRAEAAAAAAQLAEHIKELRAAGNHALADNLEEQGKLAYKAQRKGRLEEVEDKFPWELSEDKLFAKCSPDKLVSYGDIAVRYADQDNGPGPVGRSTTQYAFYERIVDRAVAGDISARQAAIEIEEKVDRRGNKCHQYEARAWNRAEFDQLVAKYGRDRAIEMTQSGKVKLMPVRRFEHLATMEGDKANTAPSAEDIMYALLDFHFEKHVAHQAATVLLPAGQSTPELVQGVGTLALQQGEHLHELMCAADTSDPDHERFPDFNDHIVQLRRELYEMHDLAHFGEESAPKYEPSWDEDDEEQLAELDAAVREKLERNPEINAAIADVAKQAADAMLADEQQNKGDASVPSLDEVLS